ncbi:DUF6064 family protein [Noviherbaspirillum sp.]
MWSLIGAQAALLLGVPQNLGLIVAAIVGLMLLKDANGRLTLHWAG